MKVSDWKAFNGKRKVLLFYANPENRFPIMPVGMGYVATRLQNLGHRVEVVDLLIEKDWPKKVCSSLLEFGPDIIGISIRNWDSSSWENYLQYGDVVRDYVVKPAREVSKAPILIGGPAVNMMTERILKHIGADFAAWGDGEVTAVSFVESWKPGMNEIKIPGIISQTNTEKKNNESSIKKTKNPCLIRDLNLQARSELGKWISLKPYTKNDVSFIFGRYPIQTKRGCPFQCIYCTYPSLEGNSYRLRNVVGIVDEIEEAHQRWGVQYFEFIDSIFNHPSGWAEEICEEIIRRKLKTKLAVMGIHPLYLTKQLIRLMEKAGFYEITISPDTASNKLLKQTGKIFTSSDILIEAATILKDSRIAVTWSFLFGLPGENAETVEETLNFIRNQMSPTHLAICGVGCRVYSGTKLADMVIEEGIVKETFDWLKPLFYEPKDITLSEINVLLRKEAVKTPNIIFWYDQDKVTIFEKFIGIVISKIVYFREKFFQKQYPMHKLIISANRHRVKLLQKKYMESKNFHDSNTGGFNKGMPKSFDNYLKNKFDKQKK